MRKTEQKRLAREGKNCFEMEKEELIDNMNWYRQPKGIHSPVAYVLRHWMVQVQYKIVFVRLHTELLGNMTQPTDDMLTWQPMWGSDTF